MEEEGKAQIVVKLYEGLACGDSHRVAGLLAPDLEWWFHGPPGREHMMRVLTGAEEPDQKPAFRFNPRRVVEVGTWVVAEGWEPKHDAYWVHAWALHNGLITQFREYFNTRLTVQELGSGNPPSASLPVGRTPLWESRVSLSRSMPGLVLAL